MATSYEQTMLKLEQMAQQTNAQQLNWQKEMSDTSHQREVADLVKAGLNPVLSANQGAQSYTTSLDSAASAVSNLASAKQGSDATRFAARQSAAATRAAAAANLKAAQAAAAAQRYAADRSYEAAKYQTDHSKTGSTAGVLSNIFNGAIENPKVKDIFNNILKKVDKVRSDPSKVNAFLKNPNKSFSWNNMTKQGRNTVKTEIKNFGVNFNSNTKKTYINAFYNHDKNAMLQWSALVRKFQKNRNTSASALSRLHYY